MLTRARNCFIVLAIAGLASISGCQSSQPQHQINGSTKSFEQAIASIDAGHCDTLRAIIARDPEIVARRGTERNLTLIQYAVWNSKLDSAQIVAQYVRELDAFSAAGLGRDDVVRKYLDNWRDEMAAGEDLLYWATKGGHCTTVQLVLSARRADTHFDVRKAVVYAVEEGTMEQVKCLGNLIWGVAADEAGNSILHLAASYDNREVVEYLLSVGFSPDTRNHRGDAAVSFAAVRGSEDLLRLLVGKSKKDALGRALIVAARSGSVQGLQILLDAGAPTDMSEDSMNLTPLHVAAALGDDNKVAVLLKGGASKTARDARGRMPWELVDEKHVRVRNSLFVPSSPGSDAR